MHRINGWNNTTAGVCLVVEPYGLDEGDYDYQGERIVAHLKNGEFIETLVIISWRQ